MARPTLYTDELADQILEKLAGGETLSSICRVEGMPKRRTVNDWKHSHEGFGIRFAEARAEGHDAIAERTRNTARGLRADEGGDSTGDVQRDKLIIDTDFRLLAKWDSGRYGDKISLEHDVVGNLADDLRAARERAKAAKP